ncbi:MAG: ribonuclease D [Gemmatimonadales bacterium]|nr:ribonuclease D [Gemmatimonadales bacterium]
MAELVFRRKFGASIATVGLHYGPASGDSGYNASGENRAGQVAARLEPGHLTDVNPTTGTPPNPAVDIRVIDSQPALEQLTAELAREPLVAVDTEAASFHRYHDRVYLLQLSSRTTTAVVDPLAVRDLASFGAVLADPAVEIVFHDADYDLRLLDREFGLRATRLFDTRVAAQLLNEPGVGLAALLEKYLGVKLDKRFQRADWSARPLLPGMLEYAAADTRNLAALRDILRDQLIERGRLAWAEEEFSYLESVRWTVSEDDEPAWLRMKGAKALRPRGLAVLREVFEWRDALARKADKAPFRVINNEPMLAISRDQPTDVATLKAVPGVGHDLVNRRGHDLLAAVERGLAVAELDLPRVERATRRAPDPALDARLERLKAVRNREATRLDLAPGVLCPNGTLEAIARAMPETPKALEQVPGLRRWQAETIGAALLSAAAAPTP